MVTTVYPEAVVADATLLQNVEGRKFVPLQSKAYMFAPRKYPLLATTLFSANFGQIDSYGGPKPPTAKIRPVKNTRYEVYTSRNPESRVKINKAGGYADTDVSFVVDDATKVRVGSVLMLPVAGNIVERMYCLTSTASTNTITVTRAIDGDATTGVTIADGSILLVGPTAMSDGSAVGSDVQYDPLVTYGNTEIFRTELTIGGSAEAEQLQTGSPRAFNRILKAQELCQKMEIAAFHGKAPTAGYITDSSSKKHYITNGVDGYLSTNVIDARGEIDEDALDAILDRIGEQQNFDEEPLWCYTGANLMRSINSFSKDKITVTTIPVKEYGSRIATYHSAHGPVHFVREPLFKASNGMAGVAYFLRPAHFECNPKAGREMNMYPNVKSLAGTGDDLTCDAYLGEIGFYLHFEELSGKVFNIS